MTKFYSVHIGIKNGVTEYANTDGNLQVNQDERTQLAFEEAEKAFEKYKKESQAWASSYYVAMFVNILEDEDFVVRCIKRCGDWAIEFK